MRAVLPRAAGCRHSGRERRAWVRPPRTAQCNALALQKQEASYSIRPHGKNVCQRRSTTRCGDGTSTGTDWTPSACGRWRRRRACPFRLRPGPGQPGTDRPLHPGGRRGGGGLPPGQAVHLTRNPYEHSLESASRHATAGRPQVASTGGGRSMDRAPRGASSIRLVAALRASRIPPRAAVVSRAGCCPCARPSRASRRSRSRRRPGRGPAAGTASRGSAGPPCRCRPDPCPHASRRHAR